MHCTQNVTPHIHWVGGSDRRLALFENMFPLENGITYNAYVILDEKTALIDTVDAAVGRQFIENVKSLLNGRPLDYLVVNHMEPDHCANIDQILALWPEAKIVGNGKTFQMIRQFYNMDLEGRTHEVGEGAELSLGKHVLKFFMAPMVHWPEVMMTYEVSERILFSADAFGTFGGYAGNLFSDELDFGNLYLDESRRYYTNIVGKYGPQVLAALKKVDGVEVRLVCPLHGPVLRGDGIAVLMEKYLRWAAYRPEKAGVTLAYASMYGNTEAVAHGMANALSRKGVRDVRMYDVSKTHYSYIIASVFKYSHVVLAAPTYNMHLYNPMDVLIGDMGKLNVQNRGVAIIGNGSWAPAAHTIMQKKLEEMKDMRLIGQPLVIRSAMKPEQEAELEELAGGVASAVLAEAPLIEK